MSKEKELNNIFQHFRKDLRGFIDISLQEDETSWNEWLSHIKRDIAIRCWEIKKCAKKDCPAFMNTCGRCWIIAGTMCGEDPHGQFAIKYGNCIKCNVYQQAVLTDPENEIYEHLIILVHSLRIKQQELKTMALHDILTGLHNRNYLDIYLEREKKKIKRYGGSLTLFMFDLNNFKNINDTYGHQHGDGVLKEFASILKMSIRDTDLLIRYGGDEFLIIKTESSGHENDIMLDRIRQNIANWNEEYGSENYSLSFSYGNAVYDQDKDIEQVIEKADAEMYKDKQKHQKPL
ncbi:MAG: GGDEF domain-containing protein [Thermodesulfovibrionia bacterium]|nr:GGDEF domain-containing protein [Thermodesulfovibrionia bacterium]